MEHKKNGYITVQAKKSDPEKVASSMTIRDESSPLTPNDSKIDNVEVKEADQGKIAENRKKLRLATA